MGIFSRFSDIINSNINTLLDKAEDPEKIIRLVIQEMEDTLVEVRSNAARTIAEQKTLRRRLARIREEAAEWQRKAELAIRKGRDDLARAALTEKSTLERAAAAMEEEMGEVEEQIAHLNDDIARLQAKLEDARARQKGLAMRQKTVASRLKTRDTLADDRINSALSRFEGLEQKIDHLEGRVEAHDLGQGRRLDEEFEALEKDEHVEAELEALKRRLQTDDGNASDERG